MTIKTLPTALLALALALSACTASVDTSSRPSESVSASADTALDAPPVDRDPQGKLPAITFSSKGIPTMAKVASDPPAVISVKTLTAGDGTVVAAGDYVKVNYAGFLWSDGKQFDSTYDTSKPASFALDAVVTETDALLYHAVTGEWGGQTSSSWSSSYQQVDSGGGAATVGKRVGSRVLLVYPADAANGTAAQAFVIDILAAIPTE